MAKHIFKLLPGSRAGDMSTKRFRTFDRGTIILFILNFEDDHIVIVIGIALRPHPLSVTDHNFADL